jgi:hypothetical protein
LFRVAGSYRKPGTARAYALLVATAWALVAGLPARADDESPTEIDQKVENPIGDAWLVKIQSNTYLLEVDAFDTRRVQEIVQIQPRIPIQLTADLLLLTRPTVPLLQSQPYESSAGTLERALGFGDIELPFVLSPSTGPHWLVGGGPTFVLPTATSDQTGAGKWQAGPAAVLGWRDEQWLAALFAQQWWSFAGSGQRKNASKLKLQYFLTRYLADGWNVGMSPTIEVNWKADGGQKLTLPVGLGVGKVFKLSHDTAIQLALQLQYMPVHPDEFGREANLQLTLTPVVPPPAFLKQPLF